MANETLGASFAIDTTDLKAGLAQANRLIRESESEFKAAAAGMDDWTASEDGLNSKIKSLNTVTDLQKQKVNALQSEYDKLVANGLDPTSRQATELRTKINNETAALNKNEAELQKQTQALADLKNGTNDAAGATDDMNSKLDGLKAVGGAVVGAVAAVGAAAAGVVTGFLSLAESTRESRNEMAKLDTAFQTAGLSAESAESTFTTLYGILGDEGAAVEAAQQLAKISENEADLEANTRILTGVMAEYGNSIPTEGLAEGMAATAAMGEVQGPLADALEWQGVNLDDVNAKLATLSTEEERAAYIQETLTGLYGESADAYRENNAEVIAAQEAQANLNNTINELGAIAEPIMTTLKQVANGLLQSILPFVSLIGEGLTGALNGADGATDTLAEGISGLISTALDKVIELVPVVIDTVLALFPKLLTSILEQVPSIIQTLLTMVTSCITALAEMLPSIIPTIIDTVILVAETLLDNIDMIIDAGIKLILGLANGLIAALPNLIEKIPVIISKLITAITNNLPLLLSAGVQLIVSLANGLIQSLPWLISKMPQIIASIINGLRNGISNIINMGVQLLINLWGGLLQSLPWLISKMPKIIASIISGLRNGISGIISTGVQLVSSLASGLIQAIPQLVSKIPQIISSITSGLRNGISSITSIGSDIVRGLWNGISDMASWVYSKISGFGSGILSSLKSFFGIHSPSRVMADEVGKNLALGIGVGFEKNIGAVNDEITGAMNFSGANVNVNARGNGVGGIGGSVNVYQTNNYTQAHSRYELYKSKQQTAAAVRLAMAGA